MFFEMIIGDVFSKTILMDKILKGRRGEKGVYLLFPGLNVSECKSVYFELFSEVNRFKVFVCYQLYVLEDSPQCFFFDNFG